MECELTYAPSAAGALFGPHPSEQHAEWPQTTEGGQCSARLWLSGGQTRMFRGGDNRGWAMQLCLRAPDFNNPRY